MLRPPDDYVGAPRYFVESPTCYVGALTYYIGARDIKWGPGILSLYIFYVAAGYFGQLCASRVALHATIQYN